MDVLKNVSKRLVVVGLLLLLPNCGKLADWAKTSFQQTPSLDTPCDVAKKYIQSIISYDQLTTVANFDVLWLSNEVRMAYVDLFTTKFGKSDEQKRALLRRQLEENNHFISFFVLSLYEVPLGDQSSLWGLFLHIGDKNYSPIEIKAVELSPEYMCLFGKQYNRFKVAYSVKFDAKNIDDIPLLTSETREMKLYFRSLKKEVILTWDLSFQQLGDTVQEEL